VGGSGSTLWCGKLRGRRDYCCASSLAVLKQQVVEVVVDNSAVFYGVRSWVSSNVALMKLLRKLFWLSDRHNITFIPRLG